MADPLRIEVRIGEGPDAPTAAFQGREAWALRCLHAAGENGVSSLDHVGPRLSHYVMKLRRAGLAVETVPEKHAGPFPGSHGRYVLRTPVAVLAVGGSA